MHYWAYVVSRTLVVWSFGLIFFTLSSYAAPPENKGAEKPSIIQTLGDVNATFFLTQGLRTDDLDFNIAGNSAGTSPNILSELIWSNLKSYQVRLENQTTIKNRLYLKGYLSYGDIFSGGCEDADYNGDNRTWIYSRSTCDTDGYNVWDGSIGVGMHFHFLSNRLKISPLMGYSAHRQFLNITNGYQTFSNPPPATASVGPITGLDSKYETQWDGPWAGVDISLKTPVSHHCITHSTIAFSIEYHRADYHAEADWNLRSTWAHPKSFEHIAKGSGVVFSMDWLMGFCENWGINMGVNYQKWSTDSGVDRTFFANGMIIDTRLNAVNWTSFTIDAGISYTF